MRVALAALAVLFAVTSCSSDDSDSVCRAAEGCRPNVLLIIVDDLRPELGAYGADYVHSPNIDRLAAEGIVFDQAYAQVPVCGASRASLLTGLRPSRSRFTTFLSRIDREAPEATTLPALFAANGYHAISNGKVTHEFDDIAGDWTQPPWRVFPDVDGNKIYADPEARARFDATGRGPAYERLAVDDDAYPTGLVATRTIADLEELAATGEPFFLAAGFWKPHLPFNAPERYWELYDGTRLGERFASGAPQDVPDTALHDSLELRLQYEDIPFDDIPADLANTLAQAYMACVSYTDAQVGRLLDALERLGLDDNTVVVLVGDNGFQLGEHGMWVKHSNFDTSLRVPLILKAPGYARGAAVGDVVELLDLYPTLAELAGVDLDNAVDGDSLVAVLDDPERPTKGFATGQYHALIALDPGAWLGRSIRFDRWLYTEWSVEGEPVRSRMLYDHEVDPAENFNVAESVEPSVLDDLSSRLVGIVGP